MLYRVGQQSVTEKAEQTFAVVFTSAPIIRELIFLFGQIANSF